MKDKTVFLWKTSSVNAAGISKRSMWCRRNKQRKVLTVESYMKSLEQFQSFCASINIKTVDQIDKNVMLRFVGWLEKNLETRQGGHPNNTYRNKLKDVRVFLIDACGIRIERKDVRIAGAESD